LKKLLFIALIIFFAGQGLALAQYSIDQKKYTSDDYDYNQPTSADDEEEGGVDGFSSFLYDDGEGFRLDKLSLPNAYDPKLTGVKAKALSLRIKSVKCDQTAYVSINYPVNVGDPKVDGFIEGLYKKMFDDAARQSLETLDDLLGDSDSCPQTMVDTIIFQSSFKILSINKNIVSIISLINISSGYFHPINGTRTFNIDTSGPKLLTLKDIFPDLNASLRRLWPYLANAYCAMREGGGTLPKFYGEAKCEPGGYGQSSPLPKGWAGAGADFQNLGGIVNLTPEGLRIELGAYDSWGYSTGPASVFIPKKEALDMGASPSMW
jgi:hypothetical protein